MLKKDDMGHMRKGAFSKPSGKQFPIDQALLDITLENKDLFTNERGEDYQHMKSR